MDSLVDLSDVQRVIDIVQRHGLDGLTVSDGETEIRVTAEQQAVAEVAASAAEPEPPAPSGLLALKSPITGVFYRTSSPNDPPFVREGDVVEPHDTVCLIEAMKIFNEITAGMAGRVARIVAQNEQLVVSGEVLMEFEPLEGGGS